MPEAEAISTKSMGAGMWIVSIESGKHRDAPRLGDVSGFFGNRVLRQGIAHLTRSSWLGIRRMADTLDDGDDSPKNASGKDAGRG